MTITTLVACLVFGLCIFGMMVPIAAMAWHLFFRRLSILDTAKVCAAGVISALAAAVLSRLILVHF